MAGLRWRVLTELYILIQEVVSCASYNRNVPRYHLAETKRCIFLVLVMVLVYSVRRLYLKRRSPVNIS